MLAYADLLKVRGVVVAGDFTTEGRLSGYKGKIDLSPEMAATAANFAATIAMMLESLALAYSEIEKVGTKTMWVPERLWMYSGGDWTAAVSSPHWAIINTAQLEFAPLYDPKKEGRAETLEALLEIQGIVAAGEFEPDGKLVRYQTNADVLTQYTAQVGTRFVAGISSMLDVFANAYSLLGMRGYRLNWVPQQAWLYSGGDWTVSARGNRWMMADASRAQLTEIQRALLT
jgi:roadblock/LC7 domain-containing protein